MTVRKRDTECIYAMKVLTKSDLAKKQQIAHSMAERRILANTTHPFLVSLKYAFQSSAKLYLVLDYAAGGDLFSYLQVLYASNVHVWFVPRGDCIEIGTFNRRTIARSRSGRSTWRDSRVQSVLIVYPSVLPF